jgi:hypothetical protein
MSSNQMYSDKEKIQAWLDEMEIEKYVINDDLTVDVNQNVSLYHKSLSFFPVQFGTVNGDFNCSENQLISLIGSPRKVTQTFDCTYNKLITLEGAPDEVDIFICDYNKTLISLKGCPQIINWDFQCRENSITSLEGGPIKVGNIYDCSNNQLITLKGAPDIINNHFYCSNNQLTNLDYLPKKITNWLRCSLNLIQISHPIDSQIGTFIHTCLNEEQRIDLFKEDYTKGKKGSFGLEIESSKWIEKMAYLETLIIDNNLSNNQEKPSLKIKL